MQRKERRKNMDSQERKVYSIELRLIRKYFPKLTPRPIKIDNKISYFAQAGESLIINLRKHRGDRRMIEDTIVHELIHYELPKHHLHDEAFKKRARELGILGTIELQQCAQQALHEAEYAIPHTTEWKKISLKDAAIAIEESFKELLSFVDKLPVDRREKAHGLITNFHCRWRCYSDAVKRGEDYVVEEHLKPRRGPRGMTAQELLDNLKPLRAKEREMQKKIIADSSVLNDKRFKREWEALQVKIDRLSGKLTKDYDLCG
jgi:hypothetical protein